MALLNRAFRLQGLLQSKICIEHSPVVTRRLHVKRLLSKHGGVSLAAFVSALLQSELLSQDYNSTNGVSQDILLRGHEN